MKKVVITGATGFIGAFLAEAALQRGWIVYAAVRKTSDLNALEGLKITLIEFNFKDIRQMSAVLADVKPDYIIHNAGITKAPNQEVFNQVNAEFTENLALAAMQAQIPLKKFVFMSSLASYGPADNHQNDCITEDCHPFPVTMYGKSKLLAEQKLKNIVSLPYIIIRPTAVYGPREKDLHSVFKMVSSGFSVYSGKGNQKLTFVYVKDLVEWVLRLCEISQDSKSYFVSDTKTYSPTEFNSIIAQNLSIKTLKIGLPLWLVTLVGYASEAVGKITGRIPALNVDKLNEIKALNWQCDVNPLIKDTAYSPRYFLNEGIKETVVWYKENKWL